MNNRDEKTESVIDLICSILALVTIVLFAIGFYSCPGCSREEFVQQQAAHLDGEEVAK